MLNQVALITGSGRRIGAQLAKTLHQIGFDIAIHYHQSDIDALSLVAMLNQKRANSAKAFKANINTAENCKDLITNVYQWQNRLDLLINNASTFIKNDPKSQTFSNQWEELFDINCKAPYFLSTFAYPYLKKQAGNIINITDIHSKKPLKGYSLYCMSKAALWMQTKALAREYAPEVRVNAIAPGAIAWPEGNNALSEETKSTLLNAIPLKKHGSPMHIAQTAVFILKNEYLTGVQLPVDGGRHLG